MGIDTPEAFCAWRKPRFRTQVAAGLALGKFRATTARCYKGYQVTIVGALIVGAPIVGDAHNPNPRLGSMY